MHPILDDPKALSRFDTQNLLGSIPMLADQCQHAYNIASKIPVPTEYSQVNNLVMCGMGGSGLAARVIESVYGQNLSVPLTRINNYHLPAWVNSNTLVVCSSYSGTTEETVQNLQEAIAKKAKILVSASGGTLIALAKAHGLPFYQIEPKYNPCNQPRMAIGYSVFGQLAMVSQTGLIPLTTTEVPAITNVMKSLIALYEPAVPTENNPAKKFALNCANKIILLISSAPLLGSAHIIKNQCNENAKHYCDLYEIPELNHHFMEGLQFPQTNSQNLEVLLFQSSLLDASLQKRFNLTQDVITQNKLSATIWQTKSESVLSQSFELLQFGSFFIYYLVALHQIDPSPIPWVDYFKAKLSSDAAK